MRFYLISSQQYSKLRNFQESKNWRERWFRSVVKKDRYWCRGKTYWEISLTAGFGTTGETIGGGIKENNFLEKELNWILI